MKFLEEQNKFYKRRTILLVWYRRCVEADSCSDERLKEIAEEFPQETLGIHFRIWLAEFIRGLKAEFRK